MIIFEKSGCAGLIENFDGGIVNLYKGVLIYCNDGKERIRLTKEEIEKKEKKLAKSELYQLFVNYFSGKATGNVELVSRHYLRYNEKTYEKDEKAYDWEERFVPDRDNVGKVRFTITETTVADLVKMRRPKNAVDRESALDLMLYRVINNAFV